MTDCCTYNLRLTRKEINLLNGELPSSVLKAVLKQIKLTTEKLDFLYGGRTWGCTLFSLICLTQEVSLDTLEYLIDKYKPILDDYDRRNNKSTVGALYLSDLKDKKERVLLLLSKGASTENAEITGKNISELALSNEDYSFTIKLNEKKYITALQSFRADKYKDKLDEYIRSLQEVSRGLNKNEI